MRQTFFNFIFKRRTAARFRVRGLARKVARQRGGKAASGGTARGILESGRRAVADFSCTRAPKRNRGAAQVLFGVLPMLREARAAASVSHRQLHGRQVA